MKTLYVIAGNLREFDNYSGNNDHSSIFQHFSGLWYVASLRDLHNILWQPDYICIGSYNRRRDWKELRDRLDIIGAKEFCDEHNKENSLKESISSQGDSSESG